VRQAADQGAKKVQVAPKPNRLRRRLLRPRPQPRKRLKKAIPKKAKKLPLPLPRHQRPLLRAADRAASKSAVALKERQDWDEAYAE